MFKNLMLIMGLLALFTVQEANASVMDGVRKVASVPGAVVRTVLQKTRDVVDAVVHTTKVIAADVNNAVQDVLDFNI